MILSASRAMALIRCTALLLVVASTAHAGPLHLTFTAAITPGNSIDSNNVFNEGTGANLAGQLISGSVSIDPGALVAAEHAGNGSFQDAGGGVSISFTLNGITSAITTSTPASVLGRGVASLSVTDAPHGGSPYLAISATSPDGMVQESLGALFSPATPLTGGSLASLASLGEDIGLVNGSVTWLSPTEHLDARIISVTVPEPPTLPLIALALAGLTLARRRRAC